MHSQTPSYQHFRAGFCLLVMLSLLSLSVRADWYESLSTSVSEGKVNFDFRYRYEFVDQASFDKNANASTLRSRLTFGSGALGAWTYGAEADYVAVVGSERYNSLSNGQTEFPVVADPKGFDLNQVYLRYKKDNTTGTFGRQRINHGNQRFVGGVAWRQNEQTYDGLRGEFGSKLKFDYTYVTRVNRIFGPDEGVQPRKWNANTHLFRGDFSLAENHTLIAYGYLMDFENGNGPANSNATLGAEYAGKFGPVSLKAALAQQSDYADNAQSYDATYYFVEGKFATDNFGVTLGFESLGSDDGTASFKTPLATLHKFQGWADLFLVTPPDGVQDAYLGVNGRIGKLTLGAIYHNFKADEGSADYGDELDLIANYPLHKALKVQLKFARYEADEFGVDTTKFWVTLQLKI